jgi:signal peptidase II
VSRRTSLAISLYGAAAAVYVVDRATKIWAERRLAGRPPIELIPPIIQLRYTENAGGAFGVFGSQPWLFFTASLLVAVVIVATSFRQSSRLSSIGLGLILGGAFGNLTDRIVRGPGVSGKVVDFIEFPRVWPVFNAADASIVIGAIVVILAGVRRRT